MSTAALNNLWTYIKGLSLSYSDRQWLAEHLVEPEEIERPQQRKKDEEFVRDMKALQYEGQPTAEEMKQMIRESHNFGLRKINYRFGTDED
jgi:hypothetical protein